MYWRRIEIENKPQKISLMEYLELTDRNGQHIAFIVSSIAYIRDTKAGVVIVTTSGSAEGVRESYVDILHKLNVLRR